MPFKPYDATPETYYDIEEAMAVSEATKHVKDILDAKCEAADLEKVCSVQLPRSLTSRHNNVRDCMTCLRNTKTCSMEPWASGSTSQWTLSSSQMTSHSMLDHVPSLNFTATLSEWKWIA